MCPNIIDKSPHRRRAPSAEKECQLVTTFNTAKVCDRQRTRRKKRATDPVGFWYEWFSVIQSIRRARRILSRRKFGFPRRAFATTAANAFCVLDDD